MGIKFKDKVTAGPPQLNAIGTREILLDLKAGNIYSSTDGNNIVILGGNGGLAYSTHVTYRKDTIVTVANNLAGGAQTDIQYISNSDNNKGNNPTKDRYGTNWLEYNVVKWLDIKIKLSVGAGLDFENLNDALEYTSKMAVTKNGEIILEVAANHIIDYQISLFNYLATGALIASTGAAIVFDMSKLGLSEYAISLRNSICPQFISDIKIIGTVANGASFLKLEESTFILEGHDMYIGCNFPTVTRKRMFIRAYGLSQLSFLTSKIDLTKSTNAKIDVLFFVAESATANFMHLNVLCVLNPIEFILCLDGARTYLAGSTYSSPKLPITIKSGGTIIVNATPTICNIPANTLTKDGIYITNV